MTASVVNLSMSSGQKSGIGASGLVEPKGDRHDLSSARSPCCTQSANNRLPKATSTSDGSETRCPWCRGSMEEATVRVGDLNAAWQDCETEWPDRTAEGAAASALVTTCPSCGKPSMIALG